MCIRDRDLIERFAIPALRGDKIGALAITEPGGGSLPPLSGGVSNFCPVGVAAAQTPQVRRRAALVGLRWRL